MIIELWSVYSHFCSKILRIQQKIAVEYCSYKGLTLNVFVISSLTLAKKLNIVLIKD